MYAIAACAEAVRSLEYVPVGIGGLGMQRIALVAATALVAAFAQGAHAADLPVSPFFRGSPVVIGYNWQGYYVGANVGWSRASSNISWSPGGAFVDAGPIASAAKNTLSSNGATGGIQTGYNWQWGNVVAGIEGDVAFLRNNVNLTTSPIPGALPTTALSELARLDWLITVRPRIGYAWDNWLFYVTGGWALGKAVWSDGLTASNGVIIGNTMSRELGGWTVGAGVEYGLVSGWSLKAEYLSHQSRLSGSVDGSRSRRARGYNGWHQSYDDRPDRADRVQLPLRWRTRNGSEVSQLKLLVPKPHGAQRNAGSQVPHFMCAARQPAFVIIELSYRSVPMPVSAKMPRSAIHLNVSSNTSLV